MTSDTQVLSVMSTQLADAVERAGGAQVRVDGRARRPSTGTVWAPELVIAAEHAIEREDGIEVEAPDGRRLPARLAGRDVPTDLAVLRVPGLDAAAAVRAAEPARVGQLVLAVGRPGAAGVMASLGVVSAVLARVRTERGGLVEECLRTDATPYPGFSGGALIDATGAVLGILTTGLIAGVPLAVPARLAWQIAETLARQGAVSRGYLGIGSQPVRLPPAQRGPTGREAGLLIVQVAAGTPADRAGLLVGDVILALDGRAVARAEDLQALLLGDRVGATVAVELIRGGARVTVPVTIGTREGRSR
jgi:S1-C subfamily serine protease